MVLTGGHHGKGGPEKIRRIHQTKRTRRGKTENGVLPTAVISRTVLWFCRFVFSFPPECVLIFNSCLAQLKVHVSRFVLDTSRVELTTNAQCFWKEKIILTQFFTHIKNESTSCLSGSQLMISFSAQPVTVIVKFNTRVIYAVTSFILSHLCVTF